MTAPSRFTRSTHLPCPADFAFDWHTRPGAFERLTPPWRSVDVLDGGKGVTEGSQITISLAIGPFHHTWTAEHRGLVPGRSFRDVQIAGPFRWWEHSHLVAPEGPDGCLLEDRVDFTLPLGRVGGALGTKLVLRELERVFRYRHDLTARDLAWQWKHRGAKPMNILVSGSTGLVGTALLPLLTTSGHDVVRLVRSKSKTTSRELIHWDPDASYVDAAGLEGIDAIVHLAGEPIAPGRWSPARKARIRDSRVRGTRLLCETIAHLTNPPKTLICASAIGYYGNRGDEVLTETSAPGSGFLAEVCRDWEAACEPARKKGLRVVHLRFGVVLSPAGGALASMLPPFKLGLGGIIGSGGQFMSCIALDDVIGSIAHTLVTPALDGPVNVVGPEPVTNREFTKTLGAVLGRPTVLPLPGFAAKLALGEMADELLLSSLRVQPARLLESGYEFRYPTVESALRHVLGK
jgi:uncharacterized protein (TIGR01777 family)